MAQPPRDLSPLETVETVGTAAFNWLFDLPQPLAADAPPPAPKRPAPRADGVIETDGSEVQP